MKAKFWTVEKELSDGSVFVDDFLPVENEARKECQKRGPEWYSVEIELDVPIDPTLTERS